MMRLTDSQARVFNFIKDYINTSGFPPTRSEIADGLGFASANAAQEHLLSLQKKGVISLIPKVSRGLRING